jgi:hypothetical protein
MTLIAVFKVLLHRLCGQDDVAVGTPVAGRSRTELEGLIGLFANTLVLRTDFGGDPTFREALARVRETALEAYTNQEMPFEALVEDLRPERNPSVHPLFQVMFAMQDAPASPLVLPGLALQPVGVETGTSRFDLSLFVAEGPDGLPGVVEYNTDLFDRGRSSGWSAASFCWKRRWQRRSSGCHVCPCSWRVSAGKCSWSGTTPRGPCPRRSACIGSWRPRSPDARTPSRWLSRARPSATPRSTGRPAGSPAGCALSG